MALAELRPPAEGTGRKPPSTFALAELLVAKLGASSLSADRTNLAIDCGEGRNVQVRLAKDRASITAHLARTSRIRDEEHGTWVDDESIDDPVLEVAANVAEILQDATGWHVHSKHLMEFHPSGRCACGAELFAWQEQCGACRRRVPAADHEPSYRDDYEAPYRTLFCLAAPDAEVRTPWDATPSQARIEELLALLRGHPGLRVDQSSVAAAALVLRLGKKSREKVLVSLRRDLIKIGSLIPPRATPSAESLRAARGLVEILQAATGWAVAPLDGPDLEPCGTCPTCKRVVFRWQTRCTRCSYHPLPPGPTATEEIAHAYVATCIERGALRATPEAAIEAERRVAAELRKTGRQFADWVVTALRGSPGVEALDEKAAARAFKPALGVAWEHMRARG